MSDTRMSKLTAGFRQYPAGFWWINAIELLERGAYYSVVAVLTLFMLDGRGISAAVVGLMIGVLQLLLYFVPLVAGALAEKFGYRRTIMVAFAIAATGYVVIGASPGIVGTFAGIVVLGVGAGIFKPVAAASVGATTTESQRNFGFTIYYMGINLGAFVFPLIVALTFQPAQWGFVFYFAAALATLALGVTLLFFKEVRQPDPTKNVWGAIKAIGGVFKTPSFLVLLVIYTGFWMMYAQYQFVAAVYMTDFGIFPESFVPLFATINPGVIILTAVIVGKVIEKLPSLPVMITGITVYAVGIALLGLTTDPRIFIAGAMIASLGELITHPGFLAYVTKIAPKDRVAVYLGYAFIPVGIGLTLGSSFGVPLYRQTGLAEGRPVLFWSAIIAIGAVTVSALLLYNAFMTRRRAVAEGKPVSRRGAIGGIAAALVVLMLAPLVFAGGMFAATTTPPGSSDLEPTGTPDGILDAAPLLASDGSTNEGESTVLTFNVTDASLAAVMVTLDWTDEGGSTPATENAPDTFRVSVKMPDGMVAESEDVANAAGGAGQIALHVPLMAPVAGAYEVTVTLVSAGDERPAAVGGLLGPLPVSPQADDANAWTLAVVADDGAMDA